MARYSSMVWQYKGFLGEPGYIRFNFLELVDPTAVQAAANGIRTFFVAIAAQVKTTWTFNPPAACQHYDVDTGKLNQEVAVPTPGAAVAGTGLATSTYAGGSGMVIQWGTGAILNGRKVKGRTFLVPLILWFESDGTAIASVVSSVNAAATALRTGSGYTLGVYHRDLVLNPTPPPKFNQVGGAIVPVTSNTVPDRAATMRSRRV